MGWQIATQVMNILWIAGPIALIVGIRKMRVLAWVCIRHPRTESYLVKVNNKWNAVGKDVFEQNKSQYTDFLKV